MMARSFPPGFIFGASTAAYQIEGAYNADGKGVGIWDHFCRQPGRVENGDTGDVACDHYDRLEEDLDLMAAAGLKAYRFSVNWTRILPAGDGEPNAAGLAFYDRLVDGCLKRGITPWLCFYHWDYAQALQERGGWANRESIGWYVALVDVVTRHFANRVAHFVMFNEPSMFTALGYLMGTHAPGLRDPAAYGAAVHNVNLATAAGVARVRQIAPAAQVGTVVAFNLMEPGSSETQDVQATALVDAVLNTAFTHPPLRGVYPDAIVPLVQPHIHPGDMEAVRVQFDFLGLNHYTRGFIGAAPPEKGGFAMLKRDTGLLRTQMGWDVYPQGMAQTVARVARDYPGLPLYITENGGAFPDVVRADGTIDDADRIALLDGYLEALATSIAEGHDVRGYFVWSLLDNFEWAHGYRMRFGLVHVDYATLKRTPKRSFNWYAELARSGVLPD
jgi:beta-glucosidase